MGNQLLSFVNEPRGSLEGLREVEKEIPSPGIGVGGGAR
jgi:hypothetical protein